MSKQDDDAEFEDLEIEDLEMSDDLSPDVCPDGISQAMVASSFHSAQEAMEIETGITLPDAMILDEELEYERGLDLVSGQLMTGFLRY
jgi:hypothetical protein